MTKPEQPSFMPEHRVEPPECFGDVAACLDAAAEAVDFSIEDLTTKALADELVDYAGVEAPREDIERSIRIWRERNGQV